MQLFLMRVGFSVLFGGAGVYMANAARKAFDIQMRWRREGVLTEGEIVDFVEDKGVTTGSRDYSPFFKPVVVFSTRDGLQTRFTSSTGNRPNPYSVGQRLPVRYIPGDSEYMDLDASASAWWPLVALVFAASVCFLISSLPWLLGPPRTV